MTLTNIQKVSLYSGVALAVLLLVASPVRAQQAVVPASVAPATPANVAASPAVDSASKVSGGSGASGTSGPSLGMTPDVANIKEEDLPLELKILKKIEADFKKRDKKKKIFQRSTISSMLFSPQQYALLREARIGFNTRVPTLQELKDQGDPNDPNYHRGIIPRDIVLGGIAYLSPDDWTIWLNNTRVTPDAIPAEAVDLKVFKDFIELRWYDIKSDQIFPIRLRTNQKFNLDSHIFLPG